jgi:hypothetical protein
MSKLKNEVMEKIELRMQKLESQMKAQDHINDPDAVTETIMSITKYWSVMNEEDQDYVEYARHALEDETPWK